MKEVMVISARGLNFTSREMLILGNCCYCLDSLHSFVLFEEKREDIYGQTNQRKGPACE